MLPLLTDLNLLGKKVFVRVDFNVPIEHGNVTNAEKIKACIPTIKYILAQGGNVLLISHLGRPKEGVFDKEFSLEILLPYLIQELNKESPKSLKEFANKDVINKDSGNKDVGNKDFSNKIKFVPNWIDGIDSATFAKYPILLCENVRFRQGETKNDTTLAKKMAALCDVFVMDAFASAHRAHASTEGIAHFVKEKAAGFLLAQEVSALEQALAHPKHPVVAIVGGSKVSTKIAVLENIIPKVDHLILGGGIANTFLLAQGYNVGSNSLIEQDLTSVALALLEKAKKSNTKILLPIDVVVEEIKSKSNPRFDEFPLYSIPGIIKKVDEIDISDMILDIGPETIKQYVTVIKNAATILWNGPVGMFEIPQYENGTKSLAHAIAANTNAFSIAGGGDTIAAIEKFAVMDKISYRSTGGGAFLEFIEGKELPGIKALTMYNTNTKSIDAKTP